MFECAGKLVPLLRIVAKPVKQFCESPFRRIHPSAPLDSLQFLMMCELRNLPSFFFCAVIAPQVVVIKGAKIRRNGNHAGARRIESDRFDEIAANACLLERTPCR